MRARLTKVGTGRVAWPRVVAGVTSEEDYVERLEAVLAKEGLPPRPSREQIASLKLRLERSRDMDGIEMCNVIASGTRRRAAAEHAHSRPGELERGEVRWMADGRMRSATTDVSIMYPVRWCGSVLPTWKCSSRNRSTCFIFFLTIPLLFSHCTFLFSNPRRSEPEASTNKTSSEMYPQTEHTYQ